MSSIIRCIVMLVFTSDKHFSFQGISWELQINSTTVRQIHMSYHTVISKIQNTEILLDITVALHHIIVITSLTV